MNAFLEALVDNLRRVGLEAEAKWSGIVFQRCRFDCRETRTMYLMMNERYIKAHGLAYNVNKALMALVAQLPAIAERAEAERQRRLKCQQVKELSRRLGMDISFDGTSFILRYKTDSIEGLESFAKELEAAMASEWDQLLKQSGKSEAIHFTAEGGFSLN